MNEEWSMPDGLLDLCCFEATRLMIKTMENESLDAIRRCIEHASNTDAAQLNIYILSAQYISDLLHVENAITVAGFEFAAQ